MLLRNSCLAEQRKTEMLRNQACLSAASLPGFSFWLSSAGKPAKRVKTEGTPDCGLLSRLPCDARLVSAAMQTRCAQTCIAVVQHNPVLLGTTKGEWKVMCKL